MIARTARAQLHIADNRSGPPALINVRISIPAGRVRVCGASGGRRVLELFSRFFTTAAAAATGSRVEFLSGRAVARRRVVRGYRVLPLFGDRRCSLLPPGGCVRFAFFGKTGTVVERVSARMRAMFRCTPVISLKSEIVLFISRY